MKVPSIVTKAIGKAKQNSPEILMVVGVVGIVVATVKACKESTKLNEVLEEHKEEIEIIKAEEYVEKEKNRKIAARYGRTAVELTKMYGPSLAIGTGSVCLIFKGHGILRKRYASLATTYGLLEKSYGLYRERVVGELGEKMDQHFMYGMTEQEEEVVEVDKKGKERTVRKKINVFDESKPLGSPYARIFSPDSKAWQNGSFSLSLAYARQYEEYANNLLIARKDKPLYLETVYDWFDIEPTEASHDAGWTYGDKVNFNIMEGWEKKDGEWRQVIMMDFNCSDVYSKAYRKAI